MADEKYSYHIFLTPILSRFFLIFQAFACFFSLPTIFHKSFLTNHS
nr:MAG TPA: hypothetical protein [Bacteriophage sp.]